MKRHALAVLSGLAALTLFATAFAPAQAAEEKKPDGAKSTGRPLTQGELKNDLCPTTGKPTDAKFFAEFKDDEAKVTARVYFCSAKCKEGAKPELMKELYTKAFLTKKDGTKIAYGKTAIDLKNGNCPVSGDKAEETGDYINYNAAKVHICCASCVEDFGKNPDKFLHNVSSDVDRALAEKKKAEEKK